MILVFNFLGNESSTGIQRDKKVPPTKTGPFLKKQVETNTVTTGKVLQSLDCVSYHDFYYFCCKSVSDSSSEDEVAGNLQHEASLQGTNNTFQALVISFNQEKHLIAPIFSKVGRGVISAMAINPIVLEYADTYN